MFRRLYVVCPIYVGTRLGRLVVELENEEWKKLSEVVNA